MATCHSLIKSKETNTIVGHPVDLAMFKASKAQLEKSKGSTARIKTSSGILVHVLRRFDFDHNRMTQSVIIQQPDGRKMVICKGSGESLAKLCLPSDIPSNFFDELQKQARTGVYSIAVGSKMLGKDTDVAQLSRDEVESELVFDGVLNFKNPLRKETPVSRAPLSGKDIV